MSAMEGARCTFVVHSDHRSSFLDFVVQSGGSRDAVEQCVYRHVDQSSFSDTRDWVVIAIDCSRSGSMAWFGPSGPFGWVLRAVVRERLGVFIFATAASGREAVVQQAGEAGLRRVVDLTWARSPLPLQLVTSSTPRWHTMVAWRWQRWQRWWWCAAAALCCLALALRRLRATSRQLSVRVARAAIELVWQLCGPLGQSQR
jgi:hypothetical protein